MRALRAHHTGPALEAPSATGVRALLGAAADSVAAHCVPTTCAGVGSLTTLKRDAATPRGHCMQHRALHADGERSAAVAPGQAHGAAQTGDASHARRHSLPEPYKLVKPELHTSP